MTVCRDDSASKKLQFRTARWILKITCNPETTPHLQDNIKCIACPGHGFGPWQKYEREDSRTQIWEQIYLFMGRAGMIPAQWKKRLLNESSLYLMMIRLTPHLLRQDPVSEGRRCQEKTGLPFEGGGVWGHLPRMMTILIIVMMTIRLMLVLR